LGAWWKLRRFISEGRSGLIHPWDDDAALRFATSALFNVPSKGLILTQRTENSAIHGRSLFDRLFAKRATAIVSSSRFAQSKLSERGWPVATQVLIPDGVSAKSAPAGSRGEFLAELKIPENARLLITVGPLTRDKRIKDLIWAADMLKFFRDDVHLLIVGDGPHRERLERFARQCEIEDRVHFLGDRSDVLRMLPHCAALLSGGGVAGPSVAILEAMMAGVPVVAADTLPNRELIVPKETGFLAPLGDRNQFARTAHQLTIDPALHQRLAAAARLRALEHFTAEQMVSHYLALYRRVLARS
jgi:glycosyltransferase involved in cell wall biosynthesis